MMRILPAITAALAISAGASAAGEEWPLHGGDYANARYSALARIDQRNVSGLALAWSVHTGRKGSFQATPIVSDGVMYVSTPGNDVLALDAATGEQRWRYVHDLRATETCCGPANRGVSLGDGRIYMATIDARLIALDAATGKVLWDITVANPDSGAREVLAPLMGEAAFEKATVTGGTDYSLNMAPQFHDGRLYVGVTGAGYGLHLDLEENSPSSLSVVGLSGGNQGLRGFLAAYDAATGAELWRWYTVQDAGWVGEWREVTPDGVPLERDIAAEREAHARFPDSWRVGGGSIWTTPAIDPELGLLYIGTGNPSPQMDDLTRPGDNLHTCSVVALSLATGRLVWSFQEVPHDRWGYDAASPPVLLSVRKDGRERQAVAHAGKTGWVYVLDRATGELLYKSEPFVPQRNLFKRPTEEGVEIAPAILGGASWSPSALDAARGLYFVQGIHHPARYYTKPLQPKPGSPWQSYTYMEMSPTELWGTLSAMEVNSGRLRWQHRTPQPLVGGLLATGGGLVFGGEGDGHFNAWNADTGEVLWRYRAAAGVNAPPVTYAVKGRQYVVVAAGGNSLFGYPTGDEILAFSLPPEPAAPAP